MAFKEMEPAPNR